MSTVIQLASRRAAAQTPKMGKSPPPRRRPNKELRSREHLTPTEVDELIAAAKASGRYGQRDATLILIMFTHGLRVGEAVKLRWEAIELRQGLIHVSRLKHGQNSTHPLRGVELRALRALRVDWPASPFVFNSERQGPMTTSAVRKLIARAGVVAKSSLRIHAHMLRHSCGYKLAADGVDTRAISLYLGHRSLNHTATYTALAPGRFRNFWTD
jgi:type 1 fimbriae regulatory protein FimE